LKKPAKKAGNSPDRNEEKALYASGYARVAGLDEAGRGALAGPVVAAVVVLPATVKFRWLRLVKDSKLLQGKDRQDLYILMQDSGIEFSTGIVSADMIDNINILNATKLAMKMAVEALASPPDYLLTDAVPLPRLRIPQKGIVKGDRRCISVACASIVAKVTRDRIMMELDARYPEYRFCEHKGYGTGQHLECLRVHGACAEHRQTFSPVRQLARMI